MSIHFGPAGNSESFAAAGFKASADAPAWLAGLGLNAYEYQSGRGVNVGQETARKIGGAARAHGIALSLHTPYYINLSSGEDERREKNVGYLLQSCEAAAAMGAQRMVVHCGGVGKQSRDKALRHSRENVRMLLDALDRGDIRRPSAWKRWASKAWSALPRRSADWSRWTTACCPASISGT